MSIKHADLATAIRNASEGDDRALIDLPLAGASFGEMTIISCTGKIFNDLQAERRLSARQKDIIEHLRAEIDERTNDNDCLQLRLEKLNRQHDERVEAMAKLYPEVGVERVEAMRAEIDALRARERRAFEQTVTIAALQREIAAFKA